MLTPDEAKNSIIIHTPLLTLNEYIRLERSNKFISANQKKTMQKKIALELSANNLKLKITNKVDLYLNWHLTDMRTDHDNIAFGIKFILDSFVECGLLQGDSPKFVGNIYHIFTQDKIKYVEVAFYECA